MARQVRRAYRYRFYPTGEQAAELSRTFGCVCLVYNKALEERTRAWYGEQRRVSHVESSAALTEVVIEDLTVRNLLKNGRLARAISDAAWTDLRSMLEYKCAG